MLTHEFRERFLKYFTDKGHTLVPSSPTVPHDDPTLLFANAGMNQFKDVFTGSSKRFFVKAVSSQKCIRVGGKHSDLDNVGHTPRHMTFFEMLGNFSFGDYFKREAIQFAFDVTMHVFGYPIEKLWVSVFESDDEAYEIWSELLPNERIVRMGASENFWSMGDTGPCGPCSELLFDRGPSFGNGANSPLDPGGDERFPEFWNLVFMQYNRDASGDQTPLKAQSVDTGAGLERVAMFKGDLSSVFETDVLRALIAKVENISGKDYDPRDSRLAPAFHVVADHLRTLSFAIADGAQPSNTDRGYVLRKILRRAVRYGRLLDLNKPFLSKLVPVLTKEMGRYFKELKTAESRTEEIIALEEESFLRTLRRGGNILNTVIEKAEKGTKHISGEDAFKLKDTYGFPIEEIMLLAKDHALEVNLDAFELLEKQAKEKSKKAHKKVSQEASESAFKSFVDHHGVCTFLGYDSCEEEGAILGIFKDGNPLEKLEAPDTAMIILDKTPFYAEKGGQVGDTGILKHKNALFVVENTQEPYPGVIAHIGKLKSGVLILSEPVLAHVDEMRRSKIRKNHSATHLLQWALMQVLGPHIRQAGSLVDEVRLRFDFNHHKALTSCELAQIEALVNAKIHENASVNTYELTFEEVQKQDDIKQFFGDKYGETVRVVDMGGFCKELCGGTHIDRLGNISLFKLVKESSIAAGVRRIEGCTDSGAIELLMQSDHTLHVLADHLGTSPLKLNEKVEGLITENKQLKAELKVYKTQALSTLSKNLLEKKETINAIDAIITRVDIQPSELSDLGNSILDKLSSGIVCLGLVSHGKGQLFVGVTDDLVQKGYQAGSMIKSLAKTIGGGGGGKPKSATAGGKKPENLTQAFEQLRQMLTNPCN